MTSNARETRISGFDCIGTRGKRERTGGRFVHGHGLEREHDLPTAGVCVACVTPTVDIKSAAWPSIVHAAPGMIESARCPRVPSRPLTHACRIARYPRVLARATAAPGLNARFPRITTRVDQRRPSALATHAPGPTRSAREPVRKPGATRGQPTPVPPNAAHPIAEADFACVLSTCFWILPVDVFGTGPKRTSRGTL